MVALHEDPEAMRRLAASAHVLLRSSVATARRLPPDVVERLARDEDAEVRLRAATDPRLSGSSRIRTTAYGRWQPGIPGCRRSSRSRSSATSGRPGPRPGTRAAGGGHAAHDRLSSRPGRLFRISPPRYRWGGVPQVREIRKAI
ncbi:hypothetical protein AB0I68_10925 [Streptomyces sp. NPDC050448]|uniref:hypothetical protein n=1 Tax=Streptomyces sp. NPDC050448 TaxID=3155404 RepID=UPI0034155487